MLRRLYQWTMSLAQSRYALLILAVISFFEASVFPIPPDALMIPMILAAPRRAFLIAGVTTIHAQDGNDYINVNVDLDNNRTFLNGITEVLNLHGENGDDTIHGMTGNDCVLQRPASFEATSREQFETPERSMPYHAEGRHLHDQMF